MSRISWGRPCLLFLTHLLGVAAGPLVAQTVRTRDLGVPLPGAPGPLNAITDVAGVEVGHVTLVSGEGLLVEGTGPVRTGVTAILPRGRADLDPVFAGWWTLNGNGEMTGTTWLAESGFLTGPVLLTNTYSVGVVRDAVIEWQLRSAPRYYLALPVVAETSDRGLNDRSGFHVAKEHAFQALDGARNGPVEEGSVGGGTGTICHQFKGGIGTASRRLPPEQGGYTVGVLVQCNYGARRLLRVAGLPVGEEIPDLLPCYDTEGPTTRSWYPRCREARGAGSAGGRPSPGQRAGATGGDPSEPGGSIIVVVATDAPLLPHQLDRIARRVGLGIGLVGGTGANGSGDIFLAFSIANRGAWGAEGPYRADALPNDALNPLFEATIQATEEAILNSMVAARTMTGADFLRVEALPHERVREILSRHGRLRDGP